MFQTIVSFLGSMHRETKAAQELQNLCNFACSSPQAFGDFTHQPSNQPCNQQTPLSLVCKLGKSHGHCELQVLLASAKLSGRHTNIVYNGMEGGRSSDKIGKYSNRERERERERETGTLEL